MMMAYRFNKLSMHSTQLISRLGVLFLVNVDLEKAVYHFFNGRL
jgi:hypothetical protein